MRDVEHRIGHRHLVGQRRARLLGPDRFVGHDEDRLEPRRDVEAAGVAVRGHHEAAEQRGGHVVGVALDLGGDGQKVGVQLEEVVGGHRAGDDRRGAGAEAAGEWDLAADREREVLGRVQRLEGADAQVASIPRYVEVGDDLEAPCLLHLDLEVELQCGGEHVEARAEIRRRGGHAHEPAALHQPSTAASTASRSALQGTTAPAWSSAVWGSLRPCPVRTHTTRSASSAP